MEGDLMVPKVINTPCDECILLAICNKKPVLNRIDKCDIVQDIIVDESNIVFAPYDYTSDISNHKTVNINLFNEPFVVRLIEYMVVKEQYIRLEKITTQSSLRLSELYKESYQTVLILKCSHMSDV
jgi:hypothetical protein